MHREVGRAKDLSAPLCSPHYSCPVLMLLEFSGQIFKKYSSIKFHEKSVLCGDELFSVL